MKVFSKLFASGERTCQNTSLANFYEKALFVKVDLATALWRKQLLCALRAMLLFALPGSSLGSSVHYEIRLDSS